MGSWTGRRKGGYQEAGCIGAKVDAICLGRHDRSFDRNGLGRKHVLWATTSNMGKIWKAKKARRSTGHFKQGPTHGHGCAGDSGLLEARWGMKDGLPWLQISKPNLLCVYTRHGTCEWAPVCLVSQHVGDNGSSWAGCRRQGRSGRSRNDAADVRRIPCMLSMCQGGFRCHNSTPVSTMRPCCTATRRQFS